MKTIIIGDIHGRSIWKDIITKEEPFDKIVFVGDYFDTHYSVSQKDQLDNFLDILEYKKNNPDKVILLLGNHDFHYIPGIGEKYSGYRPEYSLTIGQVISYSINNKNLQLAYVYKDLLVTHAGVTRTWSVKNNIDFQNLEQSLNDILIYQPNRLKFTRGETRDNYGNDITQTPIWVRPESLFIDSVIGYTQIVGHTVHDKITKLGNLLFIDTLGTSKEYIIINDNTINKGNA